MANATGNIQSTNSLSTLTSLLGMLKGSSQTTTSGNNISSAGINTILQQILGSSSGLASVAGGQKSAGLYNSSTNQLLTNDLLTRTAGEVAKLQAGTTSKTSTPSKINGGDILTLLGAAGAKSLLGPTISGLGKKIGGTDELGKNLANALGLGDVSSSLPAEALSSTATAGFEDLPISGLSDSLASLGSELSSNLFSSVAGDAATSAGTDVASSIVSSGISDVATDEGTNFFATLFGG